MKQQREHCGLLLDLLVLSNIFWGIRGWPVQAVFPFQW
jgi:hypothetical protein